MHKGQHEGQGNLQRSERSNGNIGALTYVQFLELRQLVVDVYDFDDDLTVCAELCQMRFGA